MSAARAADPQRSRALPVRVPNRTPGEVDAIEAAGRECVAAIEAGFRAAVVGATTTDIDAAVADVLASSPAESALLGFRSGPHRFPATCCVSVNEELPPMPPGARRLGPGDVVTIDLAVRLDGWHADAATSRVLGPGCDAGTRAGVSAARLTDAREALLGVFSAMMPGQAWDPRAVRRAFGRIGLDTAPGPLGHGVGRGLHEPPTLGDSAPVVFQPGMVFSVEPIWSIGSWPGEVAGLDPWHVKTRDGSTVWTEERTVAMTAQGVRMLTVFASDQG